MELSFACQNIFHLMMLDLRLIEIGSVVLEKKIAEILKAVKVFLLSLYQID